MTHWWSPKVLLRMQELKLLEKQASRFTSQNLPIPQYLQDKIAEVTAKLES